MKYIYIPILARNVIFSKKAQDFLKSLESKAANNDVKNYITSNLRTYIINEFPSNHTHQIQKYDDPSWVSDALARGDVIYDISFSPIQENRFAHYVDYLNTLDPRKIRKISVPQLEKQVLEWDKKLSSQKIKNESDSGIKPIKQYPNGYWWVEVFGKDSLSLEGDRMGHCVGGKSYLTKVNNGSIKIFSLRDKENNPHVTIEYNVYDSNVEQIKGHSNKPPIQKYQKYIISFINDILKPSHIEEKEILAMGLIVNNDKQLESLKDFKGSFLELNYAFFEKLDIDNLPNISSSSITVGGSSITNIGNLQALDFGIQVFNSTINKLGNLVAPREVGIEESKINKIDKIQCLDLTILGSDISKISGISSSRIYIDSASIKNITEIKADEVTVVESSISDVEYQVSNFISFETMHVFIGNNSEINNLNLDNVKYSVSIGDFSIINSLDVGQRMPRVIKIGKDVTIETLIITHNNIPDNIVTNLKRANIKELKVSNSIRHLFN